MILIHETHIFDVQFKAGFAIGRDKNSEERRDEKEGRVERREKKEQ